jgi:hypothetical protein
MPKTTTPPVWFRIATVLLVLWELMGCYACVEQFRLGAAAMGPVDDWSLKYYAALPTWYNAVYALATGGSLLGGLALLLRREIAINLLWIAFAAIIVMFGYAFVATDLIAHKGLGQVLPFPLVIATVGGLSIWLAMLSKRNGWCNR